MYVYMYIYMCVARSSCSTLGALAINDLIALAHKFTVPTRATVPFDHRRAAKKLSREEDGIGGADLAFLCASLSLSLSIPGTFFPRSEIRHTREMERETTNRSRERETESAHARKINCRNNLCVMAK